MFAKVAIVSCLLALAAAQLTVQEVLPGATLAIPATARNGFRDFYFNATQLSAASSVVLKLTGSGGFTTQFSFTQGGAALGTRCTGTATAACTYTADGCQLQQNGGILWARWTSSANGVTGTASANVSTVATTTVVNPSSTTGTTPVAAFSADVGADQVPSVATLTFAAGTFDNTSLPVLNAQPGQQAGTTDCFNETCTVAQNQDGSYSCDINLLFAGNWFFTAYAAPVGATPQTSPFTFAIAPLAVSTTTTGASSTTGATTGNGNASSGNGTTTGQVVITTGSGEAGNSTTTGQVVITTGGQIVSTTTGGSTGDVVITTGGLSGNGTETTTTTTTTTTTSSSSSSSTTRRATTTTGSAAAIVPGALAVLAAACLML